MPCVEIFPMGRVRDLQEDEAKVVSDVITITINMRWLEAVLCVPDVSHARRARFHHSKYSPWAVIGQVWFLGCQ